MNNLPRNKTEICTNTLVNLSLTIVCLQLNDKVAALCEERQRMRDQLAEKQETIQEFSRLMGLAHFKGQNSDREALQL